MIVAQPANSSTAPPISCHDHNVELLGWLDLEPFLSSCTDRIVARQGLRHEPLVSLVQKLRRLHLRLYEIDNLRNTICNVRQSSAEDPHFLVFSVNLDSRPVEIVLEGCSI